MYLRYPVSGILNEGWYPERPPCSARKAHKTQDYRTFQGEPTISCTEKTKQWPAFRGLLQFPLLGCDTFAIGLC